MVEHQRASRPLIHQPRNDDRDTAMIADGSHARIDGFVSLDVVASASVIALAFSRGDPIIGLLTALVILWITWQSIQTIRHDPGEPIEASGVPNPHASGPQVTPAGERGAGRDQWGSPWPRQGAPCT